MMSGYRSWWHSIGRRLIFYIMLFSSLVTLLGTAIQLHYEYRRDLGNIDQHLRQIETSYLNSLSAGLWSFNEQMLLVQLQGILELPEVRYLEITRINGSPLTVGVDNRQQAIERRFPLQYQHREQRLELGSLLVVVGLDQVYARLRDRVLVILATQGVKTFFVSTFIFILFYFMVGRHLNVMADYAGSLKLSRLDRPLRLPGRDDERGGPERDELGMVVAAINEMRRDLRREVQEREKMAEQLRQAHKMEAVGTLAGGIAHDFNNILTPIIGHCKLAQMQMSKEELERLQVEEILRAAHRARDLVSQLMAFSRSQGREPSLLDLRPLIRAVLKELADQVPAGVSIEQDLAEDCGSIVADLSQMHQALLNLGRNALQAMNQAGGVLRVSLRQVRLEETRQGLGESLPPGDYVCLELADTGHGIDPAHQERLFEPYFTTRERGEGSGLGLALVHGVVKDHGGLVTVESKSGQGSVFRVYLPLAPPQA